jgi:hypothetical protein
MRTSDVQAMRGRLTKRTGRAAIRKRSAVSCGAEKLSSPHLVATKAKPQTTEVSAASIMSRIGIAAPRTIYPESIMPCATRAFCTAASWVAVRAFVIWSQTRACRQRTNRAVENAPVIHTPDTQAAYSGASA